MSFIIFSASGYEASSTMRPLTSCHEVLPTRMWRKISTQSMILLMTSGGFRRALSEVMSFGRDGVQGLQGRVERGLGGLEVTLGLQFRLEDFLGLLRDSRYDALYVAALDGRLGRALVDLGDERGDLPLGPVEHDLLLFELDLHLVDLILRRSHLLQPQAERVPRLPQRRQLGRVQGADRADKRQVRLGRDVHLPASLLEVLGRQTHHRGVESGPPNQRQCHRLHPEESGQRATSGRRRATGGTSRWCMPTAGRETASTTGPESPSDGEKQKQKVEA